MGWSARRGPEKVAAVAWAVVPILCDDGVLVSATDDGSWTTLARIDDVWAGLLVEDRNIDIFGRAHQNWTPKVAAVAWAVVLRLDY